MSPTTDAYPKNNMTYPQLTMDQVTEFREAFELFDKDRDGVATLGELVLAIRALGYAHTEEDIKRMMKVASDARSEVIPVMREVLTDFGQHTEEEWRRIIQDAVDAQGESKPKLTMKQYLALMIYKMMHLDHVADIRDAFRFLDKEGKGYIPADELRHMMLTMGDKLSEEEVEEFMREADADKDGRVKYDQFIPLLFATVPEVSS